LPMRSTCRSIASGTSPRPPRGRGRDVAALGPRVFIGDALVDFGLCGISRARSGTRKRPCWGSAGSVRAAPAAAPPRRRSCLALERRQQFSLLPPPVSRATAHCRLFQLLASWLRRELTRKDCARPLAASPPPSRLACARAFGLTGLDACLALTSITSSGLSRERRRNSSGAANLTASRLACATVDSTGRRRAGAAKHPSGATTSGCREVCANATGRQQIDNLLMG